MTKAELTAAVAGATQLPLKDAETIVNEVLASLVESLKRAEEIEIRGFGSFRIRERKARLGRNPKTGAPVDIPTKQVIHFRPGKELQEALLEVSTDGAAGDGEAGREGKAVDDSLRAGR